ncbi:MAG: helix-turn-helix domain-containing protein [Solirubrobacteraceae bacterium]
MKPYQDITDPALAKALAHPLRTRILAALEDRIASPSELAADLDVSLGVMSYHVRRLEALGLVKLVKRTPRRGAVEHYYKATARPRITNAGWGATPGVVKEAMIAASVQQLGHYIGDAVAAGGFDQPESHLTRSPVIVDAQGWRELAGELDALLERIQQIEAASKKRLKPVDHVDEQQATVVLMLFNSPADQPAITKPKARGRGNRTATKVTRAADLPPSLA